MSIENEYKAYLLEKIIADLIAQGLVLDTTTIYNEFSSLVAANDYTVPQFTPSDHYVLAGENASAAKFQNTFNAILQDLTILYREIKNLSNTIINNYERWGTESAILEKRMIDLEAIIDGLLLITQDTEGYFSYILDNFTDTIYTDLDLTTAVIDVSQNIVTLGPNTTEGTKLHFNDIKQEDIAFRIRTTQNFISRSDAVNANIKNVFKQVSDAWWTQIEVRKVEPITCELLVKLGEEAITLSKITISLHDSAQSSPVTITPLYSLDNYNFTQLPTIGYVQDIRDVGVFSFERISAKYIKFLMTKVGPDPGFTERFVYQFGFKEIAFYDQGFNASVTQSFYSRPLTIFDGNFNIVPFSKVALEACERIETNTDIRYFVSASNNSSFPVDATTVWHPISPSNRTTGSDPKVIDFSDISEIIIGDDETLVTSYDGRNIEEDFINPASAFYLLSADVDENVISNSIETDIGPGSITRYFFVNSNDRILNYQIKDRTYTGSGSNKIDFNESSLVLFRNVGTKSLDPSLADNQVRGIQKGWRFEDPYYITTVEINNPHGLSIDVGNKYIIIDEVRYTGKIKESVLTGKTSTTSGIHSIKVYKDNWVYVEPLATSLIELKSLDTLYPYNHKLLIEGYEYDSTYPSTEEQVYIGCDVFAEILMKKTSAFDLINNIKPDNYSYYALDRDASNTHPEGNLGTRVFLLKVNEQNPDFINEKFMLKFKIINQKYDYLRLRADLSTTNDSITPVFDSYKIKVAL